MEIIERKYACDILIVDDSEISLRVAESILEKNYSIRTAHSGEEALKFLKDNLPKMILLDLHMPGGIDGRETMHLIQWDKTWRNIPIIILTAANDPNVERECLMLGAVDFIAKPFMPVVLQSRIARILKLMETQNHMEEMTLNSILIIANIIDMKEEYTAGHSKRVAQISTAIARQLNWPEYEIQNIHYVALLHDIGKINIPDAIMNKPEKLSVEEFNVVKKHPIVGNNILKDIQMIKNVADGVLYHHERYDGRGYPYGLAGEAIPYYARIIAIADAYDAMTSDRFYRDKYPREKVIQEFEQGRGTQFDPDLTDLFLKMLHEGFDLTEEETKIS